MAQEIDYSFLQQAFDSSWGRSSTPQTASYSVKFSFAGEKRILLSYQTVVNFATEKQMILSKRSCAEESKRVISAVLKGVKERYKDLSGSSISFKEQSSSDNLEIVNFGVHNPKRTALYRVKALYELS